VGQVRRAERLVVGGGIGGLTTALAFAKRSMSCTVVERQTEFGEIGAGIQLAPNALRVLDGLGVLHGVMTNAVMPRRARLLNARTGEVITALDFGEAFRARFGYPYIVTHRSDLLNAILSACRASPLITLETSMAVLDLSEQDAIVRVRCENGCEWEAGIVIGADGLRSMVRRYVLGDGEPHYVGHVAYRGTVPIDAAPGVVARDEITWWVGPGMHLIQYPVRRGELLNQVFVFEADTAGDPDAWGPPEELGRFFGDKVPAVREGAAVLVLEEYQHARRRGAKIYAEVVGYGLSGDAHHITAPAEGHEGAYRAMRNALRNGRLDPEDIQYVNAHATSTPLGDDLELEAVERLFGAAAKGLAMSSTKSAVGHLLGAAGAVEAVFSILAIRDGVAPPTLNLDHPSRESVIDRVANVAQERPIRVALSTSFGFGGTNASIVFRAAA